jgi:undecaprenyl diphosphate synthase
MPGTERRDPVTTSGRGRANDGLHAAIIMDGNGRWATGRGLPRLAGHRAGADTVRRIVEAAPDIGIRMLTLYAFSADNWARPPAEVRGLMHLLGEYLKLEAPNCVKDGVRLSFIGRRDRIPGRLAAAVAEAERATEQGATLDLRIALDYSSRDVIARAAAGLDPAAADCREALAARIAAAMHSRDGVPEVDVLVRTGGEQRLSDFMMWEAAYAELFFTPTMWPDFQPEELGRIVQAFHGRERRFGGLPQRAAS